MHIIGQNKQQGEPKRIVSPNHAQEQDQRIQNLEAGVTTFDQILRQMYMQMNQQANIIITVAKILERKLGMKLIDLVDKDGNPLPELPGEINVPKIVGEIHAQEPPPRDDSLQVKDESAPPPPAAKPTSTLSPEGCAEEVEGVCSCEGECDCPEPCEDCSCETGENSEEDEDAVEQQLKDLGYL